MPSSLKPLFDRIWQNRQTAPLHTPNLRVEAAAARLGDGAYLLDLGSGPCELLRYTRGFRSVLAVDFSLLPLQSAHAAGAKPVVANFSTDALPFQAGSFSAIALLAALQYADDPRTVLSECYRVLQPSGQLLLGLPNMRLWTRLTKLVILGRFPQVSSDLGYDGGTRHYFTRRDACVLLKQAGFRIRWWGGVFPRPAWARWWPAELFHAEILVDAVKV
ncbi:MAG TPA: class I SAM-dependent methyltransferase [Anaerolineales bacterium]|nr:class I SAM-dependent methyltransferase [Anaerolineales bacterium]